MMKPPIWKTIVLASMITLVASCSFLPESTINEEDRKPNRRGSDSGSFLTGRAESGLTLQDITPGNSNSGTSLPINALLWRASIDTLSVMPLVSIDTFGGTIITEWYRHPDDDTQQIKIAVFILGQELRADAVRAQVYVRERNNGALDWADAGRDTNLATSLEDLILTRAREIRSASISETN